MLSRFRLITVLSVAVAIPPLVLAEDDVWSSERFEYYTSIIRDRPETHPQLIKVCAEDGVSLMNDRMRPTFELDSGMPVEKAVIEVCRRLIKGFASGAITYETYRAWMKTPDDKSVAIPDYK